MQKILLLEDDRNLNQGISLKLKKKDMKCILPSP